ncbi:hypothetical protein J9303_04380 [Bacillaceae bacterium Marseille-Q3522]|nr:hypothetical protein [Bacillaceae bacterium Marseille-Q3522]
MHITIVDRVGSGDAFVAGILHGLITKSSPDYTVSFATAAAALKHTVYGDCNLFTADEIEAGMDTINKEIVR